MAAGEKIVRAAGELDTGSRVVFRDGHVGVVSHVIDHKPSAMGSHVAICFEGGGCIIDSVSTLYTCEATS